MANAPFRHFSWVTPITEQSGCQFAGSPGERKRLRLVQNHFAGPANQCYKVIIAELDLSPPDAGRHGGPLPPLLQRNMSSRLIGFF
jgi:hypothetical protein